MIEPLGNCYPSDSLEAQIRRVIINNIVYTPLTKVEGGGDERGC